MIQFLPSSDHFDFFFFFLSVGKWDFHFQPFVSLVRTDDLLTFCHVSILFLGILHVCTY